LAITSVILVIAFALGWGAISLFRFLFPAVAAHTFWDEITGPTIVALAIVLIKWLLYREVVFHVWVDVGIVGDSPVHLWVQRRRRGWGLLFLPAFEREALIWEHQSMIRNAFWWGVFGVDRCLLRFEYDAPKPAWRLVEVPWQAVRPYATIRVSLGEATNTQPLVVAKEQVDA
jgi:hypothetical protein